MLNKNYLLVFITSLLIMAAFSTQAASPQTIGNYTIHYSGFTTDVLQPKVAESYNIVRSKK